MPTLFVFPHISQILLCLDYFITDVNYYGLIPFPKFEVLGTFTRYSILLHILVHHGRWSGLELWLSKGLTTDLNGNRYDDFLQWAIQALIEGMGSELSVFRSLLVWMYHNDQKNCISRL